MSSYITTGFRAAWTALKAGANVSAYMAANNGHYYEETEDSKKPLKITKSDCPALIMVPGVSRIAITPATNVTYDVALPLDFDLRVENPDVDEAIDLWEMVIRDLHAAWVLNRFGLANSIGAYNVRPGGAAVRKLYDEKDKQLVYVSWQVEWTYTILFRRNIGTA